MAEDSTGELLLERRLDHQSGDILAETDASGNTTTEYIFFGGKRIAMLPAGGNPIYYVEDLLGTSRVTTTNTGVVCYDADFYPYGGERTPYTNTCQQNYKFEGKERDTETGNDDFGARYYSNRFGRWLSADWSSVPVAAPYANLSNPQTLNLYAMVSDDPESFADLDGHCSDDPLCSKQADSVFNGIVKELSNMVIGFVNASTKGFDFKVPDIPLQTADNQVEKIAMISTAVAAIVAPIAGEIGAAGEAAEVGNIAVNAEKGAASEARVLNDLGVAKNTEAVAGTEGKSIPDFQTKNTVGEIKDVKQVSNTKQLRIQKEAAQQSQRQHELHTGTKTNVTKNAAKGTKVIRRDDLGPE